MNKMFLSLTELHKLLLRQGHILDADRKLNTDVAPTPEMVVTIANNLDPFHDPIHRNHYFASLLDWEEDKPLLRNHSDFTLPESFAAALDIEPIGGKYMSGNFLLGPFRWLIRIPESLCPSQHIVGVAYVLEVFSITTHNA